MYPLIEIKTVPVEIQMKVTNATLEYSRGTAEMEISRSDSGSLDIRSRPIKLKLDTFEPRGSSSSNASAARGANQAAPASQQAGYAATATFAQHGQLMLNAKLGQDAAQLSQQPADGEPADVISVGTGAGADASMQLDAGTDWEAGDMQILYEMDKLNFDWKIDQSEFKFTPGDIEITVSQEPSVTIRYLGGPIYVPASADPNYEPVDVKV